MRIPARSCRVSGRSQGALGNASATQRIFGVDFSGARKAGKTIWVAQCVLKGGSLSVEACGPAKDLPGGEVRRERALAALVENVRREEDAVFGFDFPFSVPQTLIKARTWQEFVHSFARSFRTEEEFYKRCHEKSDGKEPKRKTEKIAATPFNSFNLKIFRQTYFGIKDVLVPLLQANHISIIPMVKRRGIHSTVIEICPASFLLREEIERKYKGRETIQREARARILGAIEQRHSVRFASRSLHETVLENHGGDALDSVLAALAAARAFEKGFPVRKSCAQAARLEGYIYF